MQGIQEEVKKMRSQTVKEANTKDNKVSLVVGVAKKKTQNKKKKWQTLASNIYHVFNLKKLILKSIYNSLMQ